MFDAARSPARGPAGRTLPDRGGTREFPRALLAEVHELELDVEVLAAEGRDAGLEIVSLLAGHAELLLLDAGLHLELLVLDPLEDRAGVVLIDPLGDLREDLGAALAGRLHLADVEVLERDLPLHEL